MATGDEKNGEIIVYGDNVMRGYHHREEEQQQVLMTDGGLRTGDMGFLDEEGYLHITGRIKEQYKLENGKFVVPSPLEEELRGIEALAVHPEHDAVRLEPPLQRRTRGHR